jgi:hypothetical protein
MSLYHRNISHFYAALATIENTVFDRNIVMMHAATKTRPARTLMHSLSSVRKKTRHLYVPGEGGFLHNRSDTLVIA